MKCSSARKRSKIYRHRDDRGRFLANKFDFKALPMELQSRILQEAAVNSYVAGYTIGEALERLVEVSPACGAIVNSQTCHGQVLEQAFLRG